ncbi:MAG: hypothetical protein JWO06_1630 [Bacteroidota bacterium]|nr:hypothetical protein [Bacteroidota bacterium]
MSIKSPYFLAIVFAIFISIPTEGQTLSQLIKAGDTKYAEGDYYAASLYFKDAIRKDESSAELYYKFAEASRMFNDYSAAADAYANVVKLDKPNIFPMATFWLAEMLRGTCDCKTEEAAKQFKKFKNKYHKKDYYAAKAQQDMEACAWVLDHKQGNDTLEIEHLGKEVNTTSSEFNAIHVFPDKIQFSSLRNISTDKKNPKYLVRIYNQPPNPEVTFTPSGADPTLSIGNGAYTPDSKKFYFTQCEPRDKTTSRCDIYVTKYENYKWGEAQKLNINEADATNTHPAPGYDLKGKEVLFFSSDRKGGKGGMDIWLSTVNADGTYGKPANAGEVINSQGNEITPFYDVNNKKLFFSSDWHYGYGGYDIFESKGEYSNWSAPKNLMKPINTPQNDMYYSIAFDNSRSYITSNRKDSYFIEAETCCNDIYAYGTGKKIERKIDTVVAVVTPPVKDTATTTTSTTTAMVVVQVDTMPVAKIERPVITKESVDDKLKKLKKAVPAALYFHNDEPECCNLRDTTVLDYKQTYEAYTSRQGEYRREFANGLKGDEKANAQKEILNLFEQKVDKGFYDLVAFTGQLLDMLQSGNKIEVTIKGYCSPLNVSEYNIRLGYRRVASLRNYFFHYRDGILLPYIGNGSLSLKGVSYGKDTAPKNISDNRKDTRNSVYNPAAALERRVEIISVELK